MDAQREMARVKDAASRAEKLATAKMQGADRKTAQLMAKSASLEHEKRSLAAEHAETKATLLSVEAALASATDALASSEASNKSIRAADAQKYAKEVAALNAKYDAKTAQLAVELASAKAANVAAFELANTLRAQHAKECARHSAELAKVKDVAKKALDAVKSREADAERRAERLHEEVMALKVAVAEARESLAAAEGNVLDAKNSRASAVRVVGLVSVFSAYLVLSVKRK